MGGSGTGGWELLARQVAATQRRLDLLAAKRAAAREAGKKARLRLDGSLMIEPDRVEFPCFHYCMSCGHLSQEHSAACPGCGEPGLVDLADEGFASQVHDMDIRRRTTAPRGLKSGLYIASTLAFFSAMVALAASAWTVSVTMADLVPVVVVSLFGLVASAGLAVPVYAVLFKPIARLIRWRKPLPPARWRLPVAVRGDAQLLSEVSRGPVVPSVGQMMSPLTGEPCVAYRVMAFLKAPQSHSRRELLLDECSGVDFQVGDEMVPADRVFVDIPLVEIDESELHGRRDDMEQFLRARGLDAHDGDFTFFEALIGQGDDVRIDTTPGRELSVVSPASRPAWRGRHGPYR